MNHQMKLDKNSFEAIKSGEKKIEIRLFDEKRHSLRIGDSITFSKLPDLREKISVKVIGLLQYQNFKELVDDFPMSYFGYPDDSNRQTFVESIYTVYSQKEELKYGVLGIKIKLL